MVNLRRGPRLLRKCNVTAKEEISLEAIKSPARKPSKSTGKINCSKTNHEIKATCKNSTSIISKNEITIIKDYSSTYSPNLKKNLYNKKQIIVSQHDKEEQNKGELRTNRSSRRRGSQKDHSGSIVLDEDPVSNPKKEMTLKISNSHKKSRILTKPSSSLKAHRGTTTPDLDIIHSSKLKTKNKISITPPEPKIVMKSPLKLPLKNESRPKNDIFQLPKSSQNRKQRVSLEVASEVENEERSHSVCSVILNQQRKRKIRNSDIQDTEGSSMKESAIKHVPLFNGISPIVSSKKESEKLEILEKSMNLFLCPVSPIISNVSTHKSIDYSYLALKSDIQSLPKRPKTRPLKKLRTVSSKKPSQCKQTKKEIKDNSSSLLKTPLRQVFQSNLHNENDSSLFVGMYYVILLPLIYRGGFLDRIKQNLRIKQNFI